MSKGLSSLKSQLQGKLLDDAFRLAREGHHSEAAKSYDQSGSQPEQQARHADDLAYAFYRRALGHLSEQNKSRAIRDLNVALRFPGVPRWLASLIHQRVAVMQKGASVEVTKFDAAVASRFERLPSEVELLGMFLEKFGLNQAKRILTVEGIDEVSAIGVYRWAGDAHRNEQWSRLIRKFKGGDPELPKFFGRILAEHIRAVPMCRMWVSEVDYIVPVPATACRRSERGFDILTVTAEHLSARLGIPQRTDFLKRSDSSEKSRFLSKAELARQYSFVDENVDDAQGRTVLLLDDVMSRGHTAEVCALRLRESGCKRVVLLVLAQSESSLQSRRHVRT